MPRKSKTERDRETEADDDLLLRALRQLADEALVEEVPERLLRPLREAQRRQQVDGEPRPGVDARRAPEAGCGSSGRAKSSRRRAGSS
jgi:hypothetical protein